MFEQTNHHRHHHTSSLPFDLNKSHSHSPTHSLTLSRESAVNRQSLIDSPTPAVMSLMPPRLKSTAIELY
ncbi:hypothetical protein TcWFU_002184 [Taenia crassiceps]|uniref:Uncharacterized protein n=1 Tax=Taenia crassiceps TaxID=6207 RepID=A0ABR4Q901_9CEST